MKWFIYDVISVQYSVSKIKVVYDVDVSVLDGVWKMKNREKITLGSDIVSSLLLVGHEVLAACDSNIYVLRMENDLSKYAGTKPSVTKVVSFVFFYWIATWRFVMLWLPRHFAEFDVLIDSNCSCCYGLRAIVHDLMSWLVHVNYLQLFDDQHFLKPVCHKTH